MQNSNGCRTKAAYIKGHGHLDRSGAKDTDVRRGLAHAEGDGFEVRLGTLLGNESFDLQPIVPQNYVSSNHLCSSAQYAYVMGGTPANRNYPRKRKMWVN